MLDWQVARRPFKWVGFVDGNLCQQGKDAHRTEVTDEFNPNRRFAPSSITVQVPLDTLLTCCGPGSRRICRREEAEAVTTHQMCAWQIVSYPKNWKKGLVGNRAEWDFI